VLLVEDIKSILYILFFILQYLNILKKECLLFLPSDN
jgi:hypothetical protein